jgi:hypothetical protein
VTTIRSIIAEARAEEARRVAALPAHDCREHVRREVRISGTRQVCAVCDLTLTVTASVDDQLPPRRDRRRVRFTRAGYPRGGAR